MWFVGFLTAVALHLRACWQQQGVWRTCRRRRAPFLLPGLRLCEPPSVVMLSASLSVAAADALSSDLADDPARRSSARALTDSS